MATTKFYLTRPYESKSGIYAGIPRKEKNRDGKILYYKLKYYIPLSIETKYWNTKTHQARDNARFQNSTSFNENLKNYGDTIQGLLLKLKKDRIILSDAELKKKELDKLLNPDFENQPNESSGLKTLNLVQFTQHLIDTLALKKTTLISYEVVVRNLKGFEKKHKTVPTFKNADIDFYNSFVKYLSGLGLAQNTIGTRIKIVKTILHNANERGLAVSMDYKKKSFSKPKEETENIYLNESELTAIYNLDKLSKQLEKVRDMFLIGCYTGLRYSDLIRLTKDNITSDNTIKIKTQKTEKIIDVPIHSHVQQIFEKYDYQLPKPISNQKYNEYIKDVMKIAKINEPITKQYRKNGMLANLTESKFKFVTSHTARRSFATNAFLADVSVLSIMQITGHRTESAFMKYIKMSAKDNAMKLKTHKFFNPMIKLG